MLRLASFSYSQYSVVFRHLRRILKSLETPEYWMETISQPNAANNIITRPTPLIVEQQHFFFQITNDLYFSAINPTIFKYWAKTMIHC